MAKETGEVEQGAVIAIAPESPPSIPLYVNDEQTHFALILRQAEVLARSKIIPGAYRHHADDIIAAGLAGRAFGWDVMTAMRNYHVIEGSASMRPEAMLGLVRKAGHSVTFTEEAEAIVAVGTRRDTGDTHTVRFGMDDAERAGLAGKRNWKQYPTAMLTWRAVSALCRYLFPDVVLGAGYVPEEIGMVVTEDGVPIVTEMGVPIEPFPVDPLISPADAKTQILEAVDGNVELAKRIWGDRGSSSLPVDAVNELVEVAKKQAEQERPFTDAVIVEEGNG